MPNVWMRRLLRVYDHSPKENLHRLQQLLKPDSPTPAVIEAPPPPPRENFVVPATWNTPPYLHWLLTRLPHNGRPIALLGSPAETQALAAALVEKGFPAIELDWDWEARINPEQFSNNAHLLICKLPIRGEHWQALQNLRNQYPSQVTAAHELALPFTVLSQAQASLPYFQKSLEDVIPLYLGERYFGPIDRLNAVFPLAGKSVIEFGPLDGYQTAGLLHFGAKSVTCVEARAVNLIKTLVASYVFDWNNVRLRIDDMHNADAGKYGRFDLAFAHGVYYHSNAPFLFFENLRSLADAVFIGGYCATDDLPTGDFHTLEYRGETYRAKPHNEHDMFLGGVNRVGYHFHKQDLVGFFEKRQYAIDILSDENSTVTAGNFTRFLARKRPEA